MATKESWVKRHRKDLFLLLAIITGLVIAVMGWHWTDTAETRFWQDTWVILAVACEIVWIVGWFILNARDKARRK
jgi:divalent metal cation (Fe/Co/Zn/Cd) transporter